MDIHEEISQLNETLKRQRDELKLRIHLVGMEAREEWDKTEDKWVQFRGRHKELEKAGKESALDIGAALRLLGEEIRHAYDRVRKSI